MRTSARSFHVGERVRTKKTVLPRRFADRAGFVASINAADNEIGLSFRPAHRADSAEAWFWPGELELEGGAEALRGPYKPRNDRSG